jgi:hypothetical protein
MMMRFVSALYRKRKEMLKIDSAAEDPPVRDGRVP